MTELPNLIACTMVNILPLLVLALLPFRDSLRLRLRWIVVLAVLLCVIYATASRCVMHGASAAWLSMLLFFSIWVSIWRLYKRSRSSCRRCC